MTDSDDTEAPVRRIETEPHSRLRFFFQYLSSPLLLLVIGAVLNSQLEAARNEIRVRELEVKRLEAAQSLLESLFSGRPERGFVASRLFRRVVGDEGLADEVDDLVAKYYSQAENTAEVEAARKAIGGRAAEALDRVFVVVASVPRGDRERAVALADEWRARGFESEVHGSSSGYFGVTAGPRLPLEKAHALRERAIANGAPDDTYLTPGAKFSDREY